MLIAAGNDNLFRRMCVGLGTPEPADYARFANNARGVVNRTELRMAIEAQTANMQGDAVIAGLRAMGAPCSELNDVPQFFTCHIQKSLIMMSYVT